MATYELITNIRGLGFHAGNGSPEGVVQAPKSDMYLQRDSVTTTGALWIKASGSGNTGWVIYSEAPAVDLAAEIQARIDGDTTNGTNLTNHINDSTDAHQASAIGFTPTGTIAATQVQGAIDELDTETQAQFAELTSTYAPIAPVYDPDFTGQATMARRLKAHVFVDNRLGIWQRDGENATPSTILTHNTTVGLPFILLCPATLNEVGTVSGGATGVIGSGGALPTNWTLINPDSNTVTVERASDGSFETELYFTLDPGESVGYSSPNISNANSGPRNVQCTLVNVATDLANLRTEIGWVTGTAEYGMDAAGGGGEVTFTISQSSSSTDKIRFQWSNEHPTDSITVRCLVRDLTVYPPDVPSRLRCDSHPVITGSTYSASDATVKVDDGDYIVFAWFADRGVVPGLVTASGGTFSLRSVVGNGQFDRLAIWKEGDYVKGSLDLIEPPEYESILTRFDTARLERVSPFVTSEGNMQAQTPFYPWSFGVARNRFMRSRVESRAGDYLQIDAQADLVYGITAQRRSEVYSGLSQPHDTDVWTSFSFRTTTEFPNQDFYGLIFQWLSPPDVGDAIALSPDWSLQLRRNNELWLVTTSTSNPNPPSQPTLVKRWGGIVMPGKWHDVVVRTQFSDSGGGMLGVWVDGANVYAYQATAVGVNKTRGPRPHYGFYGAQTSGTIVIEHANIEFGTDDLSSRITDPLPV